MKKLKDLSTKYDFKQVEAGKYDTWIKEGYFTAGDINKKPYTIVIPPPNITGKLHIGHVIDTSLQDIIVRRKRMQGYDTLYLPGMDHAAIATQAKVEQKLRAEGISRYDLGREKFLDVVWSWKDEYAKIIRSQWKAVGLSLDYTRERFTLDSGLNRAVNETFVKMYNEGIIYQGEKIINWDIQSRTALSNIEVEYKDIEGAFYHFTYPFVDGDGHDGVVIATTRPETMFADQALMVHPEDERYTSVVGRKVYIPGTNVQIPIITDSYVEIGFGTGVVKVTPAHDPNDFEVGRRHNLAMPLCMNEDGTMNSLAFEFEGLDRFECRKKIVEKLTELGLCVKVEKMIHSVGHSERTGVVVEPRLSKQWFVKMDGLANDVIEMQKNPETKINFTPARFEKTFLQWMENIQDWCISRQIWWGHRIPAWYRNDEIYVGVTAPEGEGWVQDEDSLDTWFSSGLWPFSTLGWPEKTPDFEKYFPTDTLVTGYDIIFFWVARMAFQSKYLLGSRPFKNVLIHGLIRDELGRKVSKSLGNGVDIFEIIDKYGIDAIRYFLTTTGAPGLDLRFSTEKLDASWNYLNKIWNISRYIGLNFENNNYNNEEINPALLNDIDKWLLARINRMIEIADNNYEKFDFGEAARDIYNFVWDDFASWYLELSKVTFANGSEEEKINTCAVLRYALTVVLKLLHPIMPFVTEEIYQMFNDGSICVSNWPEVNPTYNFEENNVKVLFDIITSIRNIRASKNVAPSKKIDIELYTNDEKINKFLVEYDNYLQKFTNYNDIIISNQESDTTKKVVSVLNNVTICVPLSALVDFEEEKAKLLASKAKMLSEIARCEGMLSNPNFVNRAPEAKVNAEKAKLENYKLQLNEIIKLLEDFN